MTDDSLKQNSEALGHYIDGLMSQAQNWQRAMAALDGQTAVLGGIWQDHQFYEFRQQVKSMLGILEARIPEIRAQQAALRDLQEKVQHYQNIR
jgi:hypothetical protein